MLLFQEVQLKNNFNYISVKNAPSHSDKLFEEAFFFLIFFRKKTPLYAFAMMGAVQSRQLKTRPGLSSM